MSASGKNNFDEEFEDEELEELGFSVTGEAVEGLGEVIDLEENDQRFRFSISKFERFPEEMIRIPKEKKFDFVIRAIKEGGSISQIESTTGIHHRVIREYIRIWNEKNPEKQVTYNPKKVPRQEIRKEISKKYIGQLVHWYRKENISLSRLAIYYQTSTDVIRKTLIDAGIKIRPRRGPGVGKSKYGFRGIPYGVYNSWRMMINRCYNKNFGDYSTYGARGITVCDEWKNSADQFYKDMGERPTGFTLDRINPKGNYEPRNCRWADQRLQRMNTTRVLKYGGKVINLKQLAIRAGVNPGTAYRRFINGKPMEEVLSPVKYARIPRIVTIENKEIDLKREATLRGMKYPTIASRYKRGVRTMEELFSQKGCITKKTKAA